MFSDSLVELVEGNIRCGFFEGLNARGVEGAHQTWQLRSIYLFQADRQGVNDGEVGFVVGEVLQDGVLDASEIGTLADSASSVLEDHKCHAQRCDLAKRRIGSHLGNYVITTLQPIGSSLKMNFCSSIFGALGGG